MATEQLAVSITEKGALQVQRNVAGIGTAAATSNTSVKLLQTALAGMAVLGLTAGIGSAVQTLAKFSQEMSTVSGIIGNLDATKFTELEDKARALGAATRFTAQQAAEAMTNLARAGFKADQILAAVGPTLNLAQSGALGLGRAAEITANVLAGFNITANETTRIVDVLTLAANSSNTDVEGLGEAMSYVAPVAYGLGVSLEETAAAVELLSNAGIKGSRAGTNLTMVMRMMANPTMEQQKALRSLGLTEEDVSIQTLGFTKALENFRKAGAGSTEIFDFFNRSAAAASVVLRGTTGQMQTFTAANEKAAGTAKRVAEVMDDNLNGALFAVQSAWESVILSFGKSGPESKLTESIRDLATALRYVGTHLDSTGKYITALGVSIAAVKFAPFLQGLLASANSMTALVQATASGNAVMLGSSAAQAQQAAAALAAAQATAAKTAAQIAATKAQMQNALATTQGNTAEFARLALLKQLTLLEAQHATQLQAVAVAQARSTTATAAAVGPLAAMNTGLLALKANIIAAGQAMAANPLTVGLVVAAAAAAALIAVFDKLKDEQEKLIADEDRWHQERLAAVQSVVKEIQARNASEAALKTYTEELEYENRLLAMNDSAREDLIDITKAEEIAKRVLTDTEAEHFKQLNRTNKELKLEKGMLDGIMGPLYEYQDAVATLERLKAKGKVNGTQYAQELAKLQEQYGQTDKMDAYLAKLDAETAALRMNAEERKIAQGIVAAETDVGRPLGPDDKAQVETRLREQDALEQMNAAYQAVVGPHQTFLKQQALLNQLLKEHPELQAQINFQLKELAQSQGGYDQLLANMKKEGELLKMTDEQRIKHQFLLQLEKDAQAELSIEQKNAAWAQEQLNQKQYEYNELVAAAKSPATALREEMSLLNRALDDGKITQTEWQTRTGEIKQQLENLEPTVLHMSQVLGSMWNAASSAIDTFVDTGIFKFKDFARSVISDITKMAAKMVLLQALKGMGGAFGSLLNIGGLATGGSFMVGGSGGTDSQLVAFKASPNERVDVSTPAQQAAQTQGQQAQGGVSVTIVNVVDPSEIPTAMAGSAGRDVVMNHISLNRSTVRQAIS
jgi:TP901 family phage tail tape measure protein